jgi:hypothetical protein
LVDGEDRAEHSEVVGRDLLGRDAELPADRVGDRSHRVSFVADGVGDRARFAVLEHQCKQPCGVESVHGRPPLGTVCDVAGYPGALGGGEQHRSEPIGLAGGVHRAREPDEPDTDTPLTAVAAGLERAASAMGPINRELAPRLQAAIATSTELQERYALKQVGFVASMADALRDRGVPKSTASVAAELVALAFKQAYATWIDTDGNRDLAQLSLAALDHLRAIVAQLG